MGTRISLFSKLAQPRFSVFRASHTAAEWRLDEGPQSRLGLKMLRDYSYSRSAGGGVIIMWTRLWLLTGQIRLGLDFGLRLSMIRG